MTSPSAAAPSGAAARSRRIVALDVARGIALLAMFVYHLSFDLSFYGFVPWNAGRDLGFVIFARTIASSFLAISGVSLVLMTQRGLKPKVFLRRLLVLVAAAALVTVVTAFVLPDAMIRFGILHAIALTSVLALPFLRAPIPVVLLAAVAVVAAPHVLASPIFNGIGWVWLGLSTVTRSSMDYVPILPWFAPVLVGIAAARIALARGLVDRIAAWRPRWRLPRGIAFLGRHTLPIYLLHQPIFIGIIELILMLGVTPPQQIADFKSACQLTCETAGAAAATCMSYCRCTADGIGEAGLWRAYAERRAGPVEQGKVDGISEMCRRKTVPPQDSSALDGISP